MRTYNHLDHASFTKLYQTLLKDLVENPQYVTSPRGLPIREIVNCSVSVDPNDCHIDFTQTGLPERQAVYDKYCKEELEWYLSGNTLASSAPSKFWNQLAGPDGHITSNYGHMMLFDRVYPSERPEEYVGSTLGGEAKTIGHQMKADAQTAFERVVETLKRDPDSRQAIAHYNQPRHCYPQNKDFPCTLSSQFFVRGGKLHMTTYQRSCDVVKGFSYDIPWNSYFMRLVFEELKKSYKSLELGTLTMVFGSLHLYDKDLELARKVISSNG